ANLKAQELKPLWARSGFGSSSVVISQNKKNLLSYSTKYTHDQYTGDGTADELRLWRISDANFTKTKFFSFKASGLDNGSIITAPIASPDRSKFFFLTYPHTYLHIVYKTYEYTFDSAFITMLDFRDTLRELFVTSQNFSTNAKFEFTKDSKQLIVYDKNQ